MMPDCLPLGVSVRCLNADATKFTSFEQFKKLLICSCNVAEHCSYFASSLSVYFSDNCLRVCHAQGVMHRLLA